MILFYSVSTFKDKKRGITLQFKIITKEEFLKYHGDFNYNFYQNPLWGEVKKENGWGSFYTAVLDKKNKPLLISLVLSKKIFHVHLILLHLQFSI